MRNLQRMLTGAATAALMTAALPAADALADDMYIEDLGALGGEFVGMDPGQIEFMPLEAVGVIERVDLIPGRDLNGRELNRPLIDGAQLQSVALPGATHPQLDLLEVYLAGSGLRGVSTQGPVDEVELVGALLDGELEDGTAATIRVDSFSMTGDVNAGDIYLYEVSYITRDMEDFEYLCGVDETDYPIQAIALEGEWNLGEGVRGGGDWIENPDVFTFACRRYALAKCVEAGYGPWGMVEYWEDGDLVAEPLRPLHQACTRMMRADYCGDGTPHTVDGTPINFYDDVGIRTDLLPWQFEAEWDEDGAICADTGRVARVPGGCADGRELRACGSFERGALLLSEVDR
ncbi:MAG: ADYC domain-containing protein [Myxococcota bacterium]|nr:ADYC domain-containing protein [Myxococcota bacterium]